MLKKGGMFVNFQQSFLSNIKFTNKAKSRHHLAHLRLFRSVPGFSKSMRFSLNLNLRVKVSNSNNSGHDFTNLRWV